MARITEVFSILVLESMGFEGHSQPDDFMIFKWVSTDVKKALDIFSLSLER